MLVYNEYSEDGRWFCDETQLSSIRWVAVELALSANLTFLLL